LFLNFCLSVWKIRRRQCGRTQYLRSNVLPPIPAPSRTCALPYTPLRASARLCSKYAVQCYVRTYLCCVRTHCRACYIFCFCANERTDLRSSAPQLLQQQTRGSVCFLFSFLLFLFYLSLIVYLLYLFLVV
jgi:hypothetical protein